VDGTPLGAAYTWRFTTGDCAPPLPGALYAYHGDLHSHTSYSDGTGTPRDAYWTARTNGLAFQAITEVDLLDALRARRTFSTLDQNLVQAMRAGDAWMGAVNLPNRPTTFEIWAIDPDETDGGDALAALELYEDNVQVASIAPAGSSYYWSVVITPPEDAEEHFYYVRATQVDGDWAYTSPVWIASRRVQVLPLIYR
jgi:hypothetical protein